MNDDRREFTRVEVPIDVELKIDGRRVPAVLRDVSMHGARVTCAEAIAIGTACGLRIRLDGDANALIDADARVVRASDGALALAIDQVHGLDSYRHLKGLVMWNAHDPDAAEREIDAHLGLRRRRS